MIFRQLFDRETCTYTYILADQATGEAVIIDPVKENFGRDKSQIEEMGLKLKLILETHVHADHITGAHLLRQWSGAKVGVSKRGQVQGVDLELEEGQVLKFGEHELTVLSTTGHTASCLSFLLDGMVFTGDCLLVRGCGRTDFQQGNSRELYENVRQKIFTLPDDTKIYPGHDYKGLTVSTVVEEKRFNPRLKTEHRVEDFERIMAALKLDPPQRINEAVPANMRLGAE